MADQKTTGRRKFFAGLGLAAAAGVAVKVAGIQQTTEAAAPAEPDHGDKYRLSEHVKKYYRTTTI
ncbi:hypothetical protein [Lacisediminimonas sp.]|uniref:hypothetical protein n=1 Tax=Lacisediminimonas sp. TaxID=3060582 RepID=UPI0027221869|nr:hypothetical protein [Lacisediminimonas sp.]MDO8298447.1 hypothetical protein [Lacisediminimonas sp.]